MVLSRKKGPKLLHEIIQKISNRVYAISGDYLYPFFQIGEVALHSSGKTKFKGGGPGLGLGIVKGIVEAHGGRIRVESPRHDEKACPGSKFHVLLPVTKK